MQLSFYMACEILSLMLYFDELFLNTGEKRRKIFVFLSRYPIGEIFYDSLCFFIRLRVASQLCASLCLQKQRLASL